MLTANERIADLMIAHQVDLQHYSNGVVQRIIAVLNRSDASIFAELNAALERLPAESFTVERLEQLLLSVRILNRQAYEAIDRELTPQLRELVAYEAEFQAQLFVSAIPPQILARVPLAKVSVEQAYTAALARPFQGVLLREALTGIEAKRATLIRQTLAQGYVEQKTIQQMVKGLRGSRAAGYADGLFNRSRIDIEAVVRTATSHFAGVTRDRFMADNADISTGQTWLSTLDSRTSAPCILRDGKQYTVGDNPKPVGHQLPWGQGPGRFHWNCRSCSIPILKSFRELGIPIDELDAGTRASMDGQVAADMTYGEWLRKQSAARQDAVLGPTRGALFRNGGLSVDKFANDKGRWLTLDELRASDAAAFGRAGL